MYGGQMKAKSLRLLACEEVTRTEDDHEDHSQIAGVSASMSMVEIEPRVLTMVSRRLSPSIPPSHSLAAAGLLYW
jgi:hypothetical protein